MTLNDQWQSDKVVQAWKQLFNTTIASSGIAVFFEPYPTPESVSGLTKWVVMKEESESAGMRAEIPYTVIGCTRNDESRDILRGLRNDILDVTTLQGSGRKSLQFIDTGDYFDILYRGIGVQSQFADGTNFFEMNFTLLWGR